jgi:hypothetical protein
MALQRIWLLNFDADDELALPVGYTPSAALVNRFASLAERLLGLVPAGDVVLEEWNPAQEAPRTALEGRAFCPTPRALRVLGRAGALVPAAPPLEVLQLVNHRSFCAELGQCLPFARYVRTQAELVGTLASSAGPWVLKRAFGFAGRGRQRLRSNELDASVEPFVRASLDSGEGLEVEPWVTRVLDVGLHGFISKAGEVTMGEPTRQDLDERGAWMRSAPLTRGILSEAEENSLRGEAARSAEALIAAGYFGPFCIDAFRWKDRDGTMRFNPRSEINARYSMGWATGMGARRPDLETQVHDSTKVG